MRGGGGEQDKGRERGDQDQRYFKEGGGKGERGGRVRVRGGGAGGGV